jgi:hypothetical protein
MQDSAAGFLARARAVDDRVFLFRDERWILQHFFLGKAAVRLLLLFGKTTWLRVEQSTYFFIMLALRALRRQAFKRLAGVWEHRRAPTGELDSYTPVTTEANELTV